MFRYYIYGLRVESEIELVEAYVDKSDSKAEFKVCFGQMPKELQGQIKNFKGDEFFCKISANAMVFRIPNVADYYVSANQIIVRLIAAEVNQSVKTYLLGSAFGYAMILRRMVVLHGGAVAKNEKGIIVTGESGAGKSTITNKLQEMGYQFICDDVCALSQDDDGIRINMAYPQQKLCRDAAINMGYELSDLVYINEERDKFAVRLKDNYLSDGAKFYYLFEIVVSENEDFSVRKIEGHEKLQLIIRNIYRGEGAFDQWGMPTEYMKKCLAVALNVNVYQMIRPIGKNTVTDMVDFINNEIAG